MIFTIHFMLNNVKNLSYNKQFVFAVSVTKLTFCWIDVCNGHLNSNNSTWLRIIIVQLNNLKGNLFWFDIHILMKTSEYCLALRFEFICIQSTCCFSEVVLVHNKNCNSSCCHCYSAKYKTSKTNIAKTIYGKYN